MARTNCKHEWESSIWGAICKNCDFLRPDATPANGFVCRGDSVLVRFINLGMARGMAMPDQAAEGKEVIVISVGPDVKNLEVGDVVFMVGSLEEKVYTLPGSSDLIVSPQQNVRIVKRKLDKKRIEGHYHTDNPNIVV